MNPEITPTPSNPQTNTSLDLSPAQPSDPQSPPAQPCAPLLPGPSTQAPVSAESPVAEPPASAFPNAGRATHFGGPTPLSDSPALNSNPRPDHQRKTRSDAKLLNLPLEQREELIGWLLDGMAYSEARILVGAEFGIEIRCLNRFSEFWYRFCAPLLLKRRQQMIDAAHSHAALAPNDANALDLASFDAIRQRAYAAATSPGSSLEEVSFALAMISQVRALEDNRRRLELEQARALSRQQAADSASKTTAAAPATTATPVTPPPAAPPQVAAPAPRHSKPSPPKLPRRARRAAFAAQHRSRATKPQKCQRRSTFSL